MFSLTKKNIFVVLFFIIIILGTTYYIYYSPTNSPLDSFANELEKKNYRYAPQVGGFK